MRSFIFKAMAFVPPIRNYFLRDDNYNNIKRPPGDTMFLLGNLLLFFERQ